jgi:RecA/RadA recombinase
VDDDELIESDPGVLHELSLILRRKRAQELAAELDGSGKPSLNLQAGATVREQVAPPQLVEGVLPEGSLFQVFGETGSYKSFVMLDLALSISNGLPWMGHPVAAPGAVALVLGEGGADAGARLNSWLAAHPGATDDLLVYSVEQQLDLMLAGHVDAIIDDLSEHRAVHHPDVPWRMVVFDTQADHMPSGDEDRAKDFTVVKRAIQRISQETGAAVGLVHHTGWDKSRERGSSRQRQALDVVMQVDSKTVTNIKQKSGRLFEPVKFETAEVGESLYVRKRSGGEGFADGLASMGADLEEARSVLAGVVADPTLTTRRIMAMFGMGHPRLSELVDMLDRLGYMTVVKGGRGRPDTFEVAEAGREWVGSSPES